MLQNIFGCHWHKSVWLENKNFFCTQNLLDSTFLFCFMQETLSFLTDQCFSWLWTKIRVVESYFLFFFPKEKKTRITDCWQRREVAHIKICNFQDLGKVAPVTLDSPFTLIAEAESPFERRRQKTTCFSLSTNLLPMNKGFLKLRLIVLFWGWWGGWESCRLCTLTVWGGEVWVGK